FLFFFSSRRRHTRFSRDWSSDVCSSDLLTFTRCLLVYAEGAGKLKTSVQIKRILSVQQTADILQQFVCRNGIVAVFIDQTGDDRSEERRVGKECGSRWTPDR